MAQVIEKIVRSKYPPRDTRVLWLDQNEGVIKQFDTDGKWHSTGGSQEEPKKNIKIGITIILNVWNEDGYWESEDGIGETTVVVDSFKLKDGNIVDLPQIRKDINGIGEIELPENSWFTIYSLPKDLSYGQSSCLYGFANTENTNVILSSYPEGLYEVVDGCLGGNMEVVDDITNGIFVSDRRSSFTIPKNIDLSKHYCYGNYGVQIPGVKTTEDVDEAKQDFNGLLNSLKISLFRECDAVERAIKGVGGENVYYTNYFFFLPALGQLYMIYEKKAQILQFMNDLNDCYGDNTYNTSIFDRWFWSSTQYSAFNAWGCYYGNGDCDYNDKNLNGNVLGLCAFIDF